MQHNFHWKLIVFILIRPQRTVTYLITCFFCFSFLMVYNEIDEDQTAPQDLTAFEELQNVLQCIIASFVEYPQVIKIIIAFLISLQNTQAA